MFGDQDWTPDDMPDLDDRTIVVTGANSGIGFEASRQFARKGGRVVLACRSIERGETARETIEREVERAELEILELDLASLASIRDFASTFRDRYDELDLLINNAGLMALPYQRTEDGFEMQFGVNHLGHFALTGRLLDPLCEGDAHRVVTVSSTAHSFGEIQFNDLNWEQRSYSKWQAYGQSKLANLLFAFELQRRFERAGVPAESLACHPGYAATELQRKGPEQEGSSIKKLAFEWANSLVAQSAEQGAWPTLYAATSPDLEGGEYIGPGGWLEMSGPPQPVEPEPHARDEDVAERLWRASEELTDVSYDL
jgi:NAD(P)-dependent dehydrogenase (short-subunit alcohol dehydrogenase family)